MERDPAAEDPGEHARRSPRPGAFGQATGAARGRALGRALDRALDRALGR